MSESNTHEANMPTEAEGTMPDREKEYIEKLNRMVQDPSEVPMKPALRLLHISHLDLDGYGATMLSKILMKFYPEGAMTLETMNILPNKLNPTLKEALSHDEDYDMIVITDLAVNQELVDMVNGHPHGNKVKVFDHHICDIKKLPDNFIVTEDSPIHKGKLTCATELYYNFIRNDKVYTLIHNPDVRKTLAYFVECVRVYDTFEFWPSRNDPQNEIDMTYYDAPRLNILFHIINNVEEFQEYIFDYIFTADWQLLTTSTPKYSWISKVLELEQNKNQKYVESAIRRMVRVPFKYTIYRQGAVHDIDHLAGVIFAEKSSPIIANTSLERNPDIDFCAVVSNNQISVYTNKQNVDVSRIAKAFGGGGHKEAAGFTIPYASAAVFNMQHFAKMIECAGNLVPGQCPFEDIDVSDTN